MTVGYRDPTAPDAPPVGARLVDCDDATPARLLATRVGAFVGQWSLEGQREKFGHWLFEDRANPWIAPLTQCRFMVGAAQKTYMLRWNAIASEDLYRHEAEVTERKRPEFDYRKRPTGDYWLSLPAFGGEPGSAPYKALTATIGRMRTDQADLRTARRVILDLRGNDGGSSEWSKAIADILWGPLWLSSHRVPGPIAVDWRVSEGNIAALRAYVERYRAQGASPGEAAWANEALAGLIRSQGAHRVYWRQPFAATLARPNRGNAMPLAKGRIFVVTDNTCFSACLDAVDLWKAAGAIQVGRETGADTLYIENKLEPLPSGLMRLAVSMKVYRGRARGNNETQKPLHVYPGTMSDDDALAHWIGKL